ncbi:UBP-type zinc finger domain-containing protein [Naasia sp. SYSU D00948]|uniref:UBP-type zinc finger domain-containing protein n=1 Tax=Naasia sp. SYSU D00948 TaxID=2817379 RepID=UPI001B304DF4|nr:UBP-type zinc finger domain-containing protein [Naasia sp. SYSU D00948]
MSSTAGINPAAAPSGAGCVECDQGGGWWLHLRRCAACGHVGCCDSSPEQHARAHFESTGHAIARSFEPGESWFWDYSAGRYVDGLELAPPQHRPIHQRSPGPEGRVPADWRLKLHRFPGGG